jgi:hypothetical protein
MTKQPKRPRDPNQLAKLIVEMATQENAAPVLTEDGRDALAVMFGRRGGLKGGRARASSMSAERRQEIARMAATARWGKRDG